MSPAKRGPGTPGPYPNHYERMKRDGKEHPADVVIDNLRSIKKHRRRLSKLSENLRQAVNDPKAFIAYVDACGAYQSMRENLFYNAGFQHGLLAARQDSLAERIPNHPAARNLSAEINQVILASNLPPNKIITLLLEAACALMLDAGLPEAASGKSCPELAAIREVLWPTGDEEAPWSPDTIDEVARIVGPKKGGHRG